MKSLKHFVSITASNAVLLLCILILFIEITLQEHYYYYLILPLLILYTSVFLDLPTYFPLSLFLISFCISFFSIWDNILFSWNKCLRISFSEGLLLANSQFLFLLKNNLYFILVLERHIWWLQSSFLIPLFILLLVEEGKRWVFRIPQQCGCRPVETSCPFI